MALVRCEECGTEFSDKARACTNCGAPRKKKRSVFTWIIVVILGVWLIGFLADQGSSPGPVASQEEASKPPQSDYPTHNNLDYRVAALGQLEEGSLLMFTGKVLQVIGDDGLRIATKPAAYVEYSGDDVYLAFDSKPQVLEDDIIEVLGRYDGTLRYQTVLRTERVVPRIRVDYYTVVEAR